MNNFLIPIVMLCMYGSITTAQSLHPGKVTCYPVKTNSEVKATPVKKSITDSPINSGTSASQNRNDLQTNSMLEQVIGTTTYDLQTNGSVCNRIYSVGGNVGATWTHSNDLNGVYPDRGAGYNYFDGSSWDIIPFSPIDSLAWPNIDIGAGNTEYVVGYNRPLLINDLSLLKRSPAGSGPWTKSALPADPNGNFCRWPRMRVGGTNGNSIHVISCSQGVAGGGFPVNGVDGVLSYSRSQDGGTTWDLNHILLPQVDSTNYASMPADNYAMDVRNNTVAIIQGSLYNDWVLWKSLDNGTTWTRTVIMPFPIPAYDPDTMNTDLNSDGVADTVDFIDGAMAVLIDNNDMVHCWVGRMRVLQQIGMPLSYFKNTDGILYWNQGYFSTPPLMITATIDLDGSGFIEVPEAVSGYQNSMTSFPTAGIDAGTNIVLAYSGIVENTTNGNPSPPDEQAFRNIYVMISPDNGNSWSIPVNLEPSWFDESVYPSIARNIGPDMHIIYQKDAEPGTSVVDLDPYSTNEIIHNSADPGVIFNGVTILTFDYYGLKGNVFYDQNQNGIKEVGDYDVNNFPIYITPNALTTSTNAVGNYSFLVDSGSKVITPLANSNWLITTDSLSYSVTTNTTLITDLDFGIYPANFVYSLATTITGSTPRCNNYINYWISYYNSGTMTTSGSVKFVMDSQLQYVNSNPPYFSTSADTFVWNFTNLLPSESRQIVVSTSSFGLAIGDTLLNCAKTYFDNGSTGGQSEDCQTQYTICSYDPNDKAVRPEGVGAQHYALLTDTLTYTIRFQNTGNDTAFTVRVRDTLDALLNPSTFQFIGSSHPVEINHLPGGIVVFNFINILLPDSNVDSPGSNGFVKYSIMPYAGIPIGSEITNTAYIFFDYNPAIVTNTISNTLVDVIGLEGDPVTDYEMILYPNPFTGETTLRFRDNLTESHKLVISDLSGRELLYMNNVIGKEIKIQQHQLTKGMYLCTLLNSTGNIKGVIKMIIK